MFINPEDMFSKVFTSFLDWIRSLRGILRAQGISVPVRVLRIGVCSLCPYQSVPVHRCNS